MAYAVAHFGAGHGRPIFLDQVGCTGDELTLGDCSSNPTGVHDCLHHEDAGVECLGNNIQYDHNSILNSCAEAGYTECCMDTAYTGSPGADCYCDCYGLLLRCRVATNLAQSKANF